MRRRRWCPYRKLLEQVGMFSDDTRDAIKGSVFEAEEPGFANGGKDLEEQILASVKAWCGQKEPKVKAPSQVITYVSAHDNHTLWDKLCETTASEELRRKQYRLAAGMYLTCQGIPFLYLERSSHGQKAAGITRIMHRSPSIVWIGNRHTRNRSWWNITGD